VPRFYLTDITDYLMMLAKSTSLYFIQKSSYTMFAIIRETLYKRHLMPTATCID